jgi:hypothetical protein
MLTTNSKRTNALPLALLLSCLILFTARIGVVMYTTCNPPPPTKINWQQPEAINTTSRDLLGKPHLYYFWDSADKVSWLFCTILESAVFNNRELASIMQTEFVPYKVKKDSNENSLAASLCEKLEVNTFPSIVITLPDGEYVDRAVWQSDRMLTAFLRDQKSSCLRAAGYDGMKTQKYPIASTAFAQYLERCNIDEKRPRSWIYMYMTIALMHQNQIAKAEQVATQAAAVYKSDSGKKTWPRPCLLYLAGKLTSAELIEAAKKEGDAAANSTAHYCIAEKQLASGNEEAAKKEFLLTIKIDTHSRYAQSRYARAELKTIGIKAGSAGDDDKSTDIDSTSDPEY